MNDIKDLTKELQRDEIGNIKNLSLQEKIKEYKYEYNYIQLINDFVSLKNHRKDNDRKDRIERN